METLGHIRGRTVTYVNVRQTPDWAAQLPDSQWLVFSIANAEDRALLEEVVPICLNHAVAYCCAAGELASLTDDLFDEEIVWRAVKGTEQTGVEYDYSTSPMTTWHTHFSEGLWYAATVAEVPGQALTHVVCLDLTQRGVRGHLKELTEKIQNHWVPSDEASELPRYDDEA